MSTYIKPVSDLSNAGTLDQAADKIVVLDVTDNKPKLITVDEFSTQTGLTGKEVTSNKSTNVVADSASNTKYPSVKAVYDWMISIVAGKENTISAGTTGQYFRGDKTFQTLNKAAVGLSAVQNVDQTDASNLTSGTVNDARLPSTVIKTGVPVDLNNQTLFNYKKNVVAVGSSGIFQITNAHHGRAVVIGHGSGTVDLVFTTTFEVGAEVDIWVSTQQAIKIGALSGLTVFFANGTVIFPPSTYTIPAPAPGKKFKAFCPSSGVILISGDIS